MLLVNVLTYSFLWELSPWSRDKIEKVVIFSVLGSIFLQVMISMHCFLASIKILWLKIEEIRALEFKERFENIVDESITNTTKT